MGNSNQLKAPSYSFWGIMLGQFFKQKEYSQKCPEKIIKDIQSVNLTNKRYIVTGASSGIGREITKILAAQGAHVIMVSRSLENLKKVADEISQELQQEGKKGSFSQESLDLADVEKVVQFCEKILKSEQQLDGLINNGGALPTHQIIKNKNLEETVAVHIVSPFILSVLLLPLIEKVKGRIIHNSSAGAYSQQLYTKLIEANFAPCVEEEKKQQEKSENNKKYKDGAIVYAQAKRAMIELSDLMGEMFWEKNNSVLVTCAHPGWCQTPGLKTLLDQHENYKDMKFRPALDGAYGIVWCAIHSNVQRAQFYFDGEQQKKHQTLAGTQANNKDLIALWEFCNSYLPQDKRYPLSVNIKK